MYKAKSPPWLNTTLPETFFFSLPFLFIYRYTHRGQLQERLGESYLPSVQRLSLSLCYGLNVSSLNFYIETQPYGEGIRRQGLWEEIGRAHV